MAAERAVTAAVDRAVETATVDDEGVRYDPHALAAVIRLCSSGSSREIVLATVERVLLRWINGLDRDRSLAAVVLVERIEAGTTQRQVVVETIQGDVGTGEGG